MLARGVKRALPVVGLLLVVFVFLAHRLSASSRENAILNHNLNQHHHQRPPPPPPSSEYREPLDSNGLGGGSGTGGGTGGEEGGIGEAPTTHREVFSVSTLDKKFFTIEFGHDEPAINPSILPHPSLDGTFIVVAQRHRGGANDDDHSQSSPFTQLACLARFTTGGGSAAAGGGGGSLRCINKPFTLPIPATTGEPSNCVGDLAYFSLNVGPHDARVFYGPDGPFAMYGSNSDWTCFGLWMVDFTTLMPKVYEEYSSGSSSSGSSGSSSGSSGSSGSSSSSSSSSGSSSNAVFGEPTELQRPPPYAPVEKNWFVFWDDHRHMYLHFDAAPKRAFAKLKSNGSVGPDLAPRTAARDDRCIAKFLPTVAPQLESLHQATNSLAVTLCSREDVSCEASDANTFILTVIQHKTFYNFHAVYEPYVVLFQQRLPFELHAVSSKPIWIHGRGKGQGKPKPESSESAASPESGAKEQEPPAEMFYITSLSWKARDQTYHGYSDDVLFIGFGIEDSKTAGIDVVASELLADLSACANM